MGGKTAGVYAPAQTGSRSSAFRPDVQGLRALAVIAVVLFHAGAIVPGGFVGVDMFFVVSGFVITSSLLREHRDQGAINLTRFYGRRFKRLLPALALVVTVTVLGSGFLLSPLGPQQNAAITGVAAMFSAGNIAISLTTGDYFDSPAELNPLLHTWSLSVEEQFYFVFPIAIIAALWLGRNRLRAIVLILSAGTAVSLMLALLSPIIQLRFPTDLLGFYSPVPRAWEFGVGALVAVWLLHRPPLLNQFAARMLYFVGFGLLGVSFVWINAETPFPGPMTLLPVVGTALLIVGGLTKPFERFDPLRSTPARLVGDWSYSIYLWHWPAVSFAIVIWPDNFAASLTAAVVSLVPAIGSFYLLEQPLRYAVFRTTREKVTIVGLTLAIPFAASAGAWLLAEVMRDQVADATRRAPGYYLGCHGPGAPDEKLGVCTWDELASPGTPPVYLTGDSNAAHWTEGVREVAETRGSALSVMTASACPLLDGVQPGAADTARENSCERWQESVFEYLDGAEKGVVIMSAVDSYWLEEWVVSGPNNEASSDPSIKLSLLESGLSGAVERLGAAGHTVIIIHTAPQWVDGYEWRLDECTLLETLEGCNQTMPLDAHLLRTAPVRHVIDDVARKKAVSVVDFTEKICPEETCRTFSDPDWVYRDDSHVTNSFARSLTSEWGEIFDTAFSNRAK